MLNVEKFLHEVGLGVKGQSNLVIAGSPRNSFRASVGALVDLGGATLLPMSVKLRIPRRISRQSVREG